MSASVRRFVLILLTAALPTQALATIVKPVCERDWTSSSAHAHHDAHTDGGQHSHDTPLPSHDHPLTTTDLGLDHCSSGCALALPAAAVKPIIAPAARHDSFAATGFSGHIPEQPHRPPRS